MDPAIADEDVLHLQGLYRFSLKDDRELAKRMIKEKGSVDTAYSHSDYDYNFQHHAFYSNVKRKVNNHAIVLVGWDDNFPKENFSDQPEYQPEGNGAWLVRNSWTSVDNQDTFDMYGYFWISYYDMTLEDTAYALDFEAAGYYTVPLAAGVKMRPGTDFAVVLTPSKESEEIQVVREATLRDFYKTVAHAERGRGFIADNGSNWCDSMDWKFLDGIHGDLKIKAFTDLCEETVEAPAGITLSPDTLHLNVGETRQLTATLKYQA